MTYKEKNDIVNSFLSTYRNYFRTNDVTRFMEELKELDSEELLIAVSTVKLKNPTEGLLLAIFTGYLGFDRFFMDDIGYGIVKFFTCGLFGFGYVLDIFLIPISARRNNRMYMSSAITFAKANAKTYYTK